MLWINKPEVLFDLTRLKYYMPGPNLTWEEQANALIRFVIYLSLILYLFKGNPMHLIFPPLMLMGIQYYLHQNNQLQPMLVKMFNSKPTDAEITRSTSTNPTMDLVKVPTDAASQPGKTDATPPSDDQVIEKFGPNHNPNPELNIHRQRHIKHPMGLHQDAEIENEVDRLLAEQLGVNHHREPKSTIGPRPDMALVPPEPEFKPKEIDCKPATADNPFGNALPFDPIERQVNRVCPDEFAKDKKFYSGLFNNLDDIFDRNNSQRQFTTNPASTRVNDREAAIQFFYNTPYTEH